MWYNNLLPQLTQAQSDLQVLQDGIQQVPQYVSATRMHVTDLLTGYPAQASRRGMLATVDDLFGALDGTLRCGYDGTNYFWQPSGLPEFYAGQALSGDVTLHALLSPTIVPLSGVVGLGATRKITLSTANVWPGARKRIIAKGLGTILGSVQILSGVSNLLSMLTNGTYDVAVDYSSGTPQWVQI